MVGPTAVSLTHAFPRTRHVEAIVTGVRYSGTEVIARDLEVAEADGQEFVAVQVCMRDRTSDGKQRSCCHSVSGSEEIRIEGHIFSPTHLLILIIFSSLSPGQSIRHPFTLSTCTLDKRGYNVSQQTFGSMRHEKKGQVYERAIMESMRRIREMRKGYQGN